MKYTRSKNNMNADLPDYTPSENSVFYQTHSFLRTSEIKHSPNWSILEPDRIPSSFSQYRPEKEQIIAQAFTPDEYVLNQTTSLNKYPTTSNSRNIKSFFQNT